MGKGGRTMELIVSLCDAYGPAGREEGVRDLIAASIKNHAEDITTDRLGNLIVHIPASSDVSEPKRLMLCAHMDEIGVIITHIDKNGFLRFAPVGGVFQEHSAHQRVVFRNGTIGIIGVETKKDTPKPPRFDHLYIDIGAGTRENAEKQVHIGDIAAFYQKATTVNGRIIGKAMDDRIGCYCLIETIKRLEHSSHDLYCVFSVQEEVGLRGARTGAYAIAPDYAIAVDVTGTGDTPESVRMDVCLGKGTAIKVKDRAFISHPLLKDLLVKFARAAAIPHQLEILEWGTTDAAVIQLVKDGVISGVLSIPTRYIHTTNEMCDLADVKATIDLLTYLCEHEFEGS